MGCVVVCESLQQLRTPPAQSQQRVRSSVVARAAWEDEADSFLFDVDESYTRPIARAAHAASDDSSLVSIVVPVAIVATILLLLSVVTVDDDNDLRPPTIGSSRLPSLRDWLGEDPSDFEATPSRRRASRRPSSFPSLTTEMAETELQPVAGALDLWAATFFQWRVFALETGGYPVGFRQDLPAIELLRAVLGFFMTGLPNAERYEARALDDFELGPDATLLARPKALPFGVALAPDRVVRTCAAFVEGAGISIVCKAKDDAQTLGLVSLRLRRLPPAEASWELLRRYEGRDPRYADPPDEAEVAAAAVREDYRLVAYINGLAVARVARRRGVASELVEYCERKGRAWGADALALHVNKLNAPALRLYARLGFEVVPDWHGYIPNRFLLCKDLLKSDAPPFAEADSLSAALKFTSQRQQQPPDATALEATP